MRKRGKGLLTRLRTAREVTMTPEQRERQRRAFAYGNAKLSDPSVTRSDVERVADQMNKEGA